ncbi:MAG: hypothetical protein GX774_16250 [Armatimonadetes bacterium]|nr:hypothetical protein [Armatimonadota bacterium]
MLSTAVVVTGAGAVPVEETAYGRSGLRLEIRPDPKGLLAHGSFATVEGTHARAGISARWIAVVDPLAAPYYPSAFIPTDVPDAAANEALFQEWVRVLHENKLPVVSWYPLIFSKSGVAAHPEWRQRFLIPEPEGHTKGITACFHTGFGEALIRFCNEAIERFGLDGFWFDGSAWTQIWDRPLPLSCACDACRALFHQETGLDLPTRVDWSDPTFRRWVAWRYDAFARYIGRLARAIRQRHPHAAIVVNHYHRPTIPWHSAIPLNPFEADIITGSEATGPARVDLTMRLCRAYGRKQSEVWRPFTDGSNVAATNDLVHHALDCITAGGMPSFGGGVLTAPEAVAAVQTVSQVIDTLLPYVGGSSVKDAVLHLSQQAETFYFSRAPKGLGWDVEPFWASVESWTDGFGGAHRPPDYLYDRTLTRQGLAGYRLLLMPMSLALSEAQARTVIAFVQGGGTLLLGIGVGHCDEWGEPRPTNPLGEAFGFAWERIPSPEADEIEAVTLVPAEGGEALNVLGLHAPFRLRGDEWQVLYRHGTTPDAAPAIATRSFGKGRVLLIDTDLGAAPAGWQAVYGGDTRIAVTDERARQGRQALKLVDGPRAEHSFFPDVEMNFSRVALPRYPGLRFACDLWMEPRAAVSIELRQRHNGVRLGPSLHFAGGKVKTHAGELGAVPAAQWVHVEIAVRFAETTGAVYDLTLEGEEGPLGRYTDLPCIHSNFNGCNWAVLFGAGEESATFYVDNLRLERVDAAGRHTVALADDFEAIPVGGTQPRAALPPLAGVLTMLAARYAPPVIAVEAPASVRLGAFRQGRQVILHLHNRQGTPAEWKQPVGPAVTLALDFPARRARRLLTGEALPLHRAEGRTRLTVPSIGLHEVVIVEIP